MKYSEIKDKYPILAEAWYVNELADIARRSSSRKPEMTTLNTAFNWDSSTEGWDFWSLIYRGKFLEAEEKYPEYAHYFTGSSKKSSEELNTLLLLL